MGNAYSNVSAIWLMATWLLRIENLKGTTLSTGFLAQWLACIF